MLRLFSAILLSTSTLVAASLSVAQAALPASDVIPARGGPIRITAKFHASTQLEYGGKVIAVDPLGFASWTKKADLILITHPHGDHLDLAAIAKLLKPKNGTMVYAPAQVVKQIKAIRRARVAALSPGQSGVMQTKKGLPNIGIRAVPMYNLVRGPAPGKKYHPKASRWNGYYLTLGGKRIYFAGDTEAVPEMKNLRGIYAAFLPMNLPYTMTPNEAAAAARAFRPKVVYPYHYRYPFDKDSGNERTFARLLRGSGIQVRLLDWYPAAALRKAAMKK